MYSPGKTRLVFLKKQTDLSTFLVDHLYRNLIAHRIGQGIGDAVWYNLRPASFSLRHPALQPHEVSLSSRLITSYFPTCVVPYIYNVFSSIWKILCPPLRSSSNVTSSIESFLVSQAVSHVPFKAPREFHSDIFFKHLFCDIWIICLHICPLQKVVNFPKQRLYLTHLCSPWYLV